MKLKFVELPRFTDALTRIDDDEAYSELQRELIRDPEKGMVIERSGGLRKVRMALAGMGKRGGARIIYLRLPERQTVIFFYLYTKGEMDDLDSKQMKRLREAVEIIKREFSK